MRERRQRQSCTRCFRIRQLATFRRSTVFDRIGVDFVYIRAERGLVLRAWRVCTCEAAQTAQAGGALQQCVPSAPTGDSRING